MFKLVVLSALLAAAVAKPHIAVSYAAPIVKTIQAPLVATATSYQSRTDIVSKPVIAPVVAAYSVAPVVAQTVAYSAPAVKEAIKSEKIQEIKEENQQPQYIVQSYAAPIATYSAPIAYAPIPVTGTAYTKNIHYAEKDVVTGYNAQIIKPNLGSLITPAATVSQTNVQAAARAVHTITPTVTKIEPEITVKNVQVGVAVPTPVVSQVEVTTPIVKGAPVVSFATPVAYSSYAAPVAYAGHVAAPVAYVTYPGAYVQNW